MGKEIPVVARDINVELAASGKPEGKKVLVFVGIEPEQLGNDSKLFSNAPPDLNDFEKQLSAVFVGQLKKLGVRRHYRNRSYLQWGLAQNH